MSRLHEVVGDPAQDAVRARDIDGREHGLSLLAYEGPTLAIGDWVVAHSGYALEKADPAEAAAAVAEMKSLRTEELP